MSLCDYSNTTVLVIDDEDLIRQSIATYLEDSGFQVVQADDGRTGLKMARACDPDVILLDLRMPEMDGLEVLAEVTRDLVETPVIVVTGAGVLKDAIESVRLGAFDFISKPIIDMAILEHAVCKAVDRRRLRLEIIQYHRHLESEVAARTRDLQQRSIQLGEANDQLNTEIAERHRVEAALRHSQSQLADVIAVFEGHIYAVNAQYQLTFMNSRLMAQTECEQMGGICYQVIYQLEAPCSWCPMAKVMQGETVRCETQSPRDGRWHYGIYSPQVDAGGDIAGCQAIVIDIHDRKQAEELLRFEADRLQAHNLRLRQSLQGTMRFGEIIGKSAPMHAVYESILKAAESAANVIIYGESGTGKELVARTIHDLSERGDRAFIPVNCGAIPDNLFESEFFGYKKGAFTGADQDRKGFLTMAQGGTLFLDEVGEIPASMQVKLLRAIDGGGFTPLGGHQVILPDVRIVAATNRDLLQQVASGEFRKDFYYRIHVVPISLPPLCQRREDIPLLIHHFLQIFNRDGHRQSIPENIMQAMQHYHWPGNVRELQNAVQQYIALQDVDLIATLPPGAEQVRLKKVASEDIMAAQPKLNDAVRDFEKRYIEQLLIAHQWHRSRVAELLGIDRRTLFRKIQAYGIK